MLDAFRLFTGKKDLSEIGLPWLHASQEFNDPARHGDYHARRNATGRTALSIYIARALTAALEGHVQEVGQHADGFVLTVASRSEPGKQNLCWSHAAAAYWLPNAEAAADGQVTHLTYHLPLLSIAEALYQTGLPSLATDFLDAYEGLLAAYTKHGWSQPVEAALVRAADELYYWTRYGGLAVDKANDRFPSITVANSLAPAARPPSGPHCDEKAFSDLSALRRLRQPLAAAPARRPKPRPAPTTTGGGFVGWQVDMVREALKLGLNALLAGQTGTGKTMAVDEAVLTSAYTLVTVEGKEGLQDLDWLGAHLPQTDRSHRWVDGPLLRAMRLAQQASVVLFVDELNRIPRVFQNILLGVMNQKSAERCAREGVPVTGDGPFYVVEVPMTSEVVWCPCAQLRFIAAGNFGGDYSVYPLDPAIRRRFDLVIEFDYLERTAEEKLVKARTGLSPEASAALCLTAEHTREMRRTAALPGCIDTASLLTWARLCAGRHAATLADVLQIGKLVWADVVCGRDHQGEVNLGKFLGLADWLKDQKPKLPPGDLDRLGTWSF